MAYNEELSWLQLLSEACEDGHIDLIAHSNLGSVENETEKVGSEESTSITFAYECIFSSSYSDDDGSFSGSQYEIMSQVINLMVKKSRLRFVRRLMKVAQKQ